MASSNQHYIFYLEPSRIGIYGQGMQSVYPLMIPPTAVRDMEILNKEQLFSVVDAFITANGLPSGIGTIVISDLLLFEKQIAVDPTDEAKKKKAEHDYVENVPFEQPAFLSFPNGNTLQIMSTNEDLYLGVKRAFEKRNIQINYIVPVRSFGNVQINPQVGMDVASANFFLENIEQAKHFAFTTELPAAPEQPGETHHEVHKPTGPSKSHLPIYLSVFGFLILILLVVVVVSNQPSPKKPISTSALAQAQIPPPAATVPTAAVVPAEAPQTATPAAVLNKAGLRVQIKTSAAMHAKADELKTKLATLGYASTDIVEAETTDKTIVYMSQLISADQRPIIEADMTTALSDYTIQQVDQTGSDVIIALGKSL